MRCRGYEQRDIPCWALVVVLLVSCARAERDKPDLPSPPVPTPGGCHNVEIDGACTLLGVTSIADGDDMPVPTAAPPSGVIRPDASANPDGLVTYLASYEMTPSDGRVSPRIRVRATMRDRPVLEQYFSTHRNARCAGVIINPPCPPGVQVVVQLPAPPVGTVVREP
jgi:hypothetical protein